MRVSAWLVTLLLASLTAGAGDDVTAAQAVISAQAEAFSHDDAASAYSYAAPAIHDLFPQAGIFMFMVQNNYAPVYRHGVLSLARRGSRAAGSRNASISSTPTVRPGKRCIRWSNKRRQYQDHGLLAPEGGTGGEGLRQCQPAPRRINSATMM